MASDVTKAHRRRELVDAAKQVARDRGLSGTNVRAVAAQASVSAGSVLYYYPSFDELIAEAVEGVIEQFYEQRRSAAEKHSDPFVKLLTLIEAGVPDDISDDLRIVYEGISLGRQQPQLRVIYRSIVERQVVLYRSALEFGTALGAFTPRSELSVIARNLVALEDAYDLYPLIGVNFARESCRDNVISYAELALGCSLRR